MATARILLYNAVLFILISACDSVGIQCVRGKHETLGKWEWTGFGKSSIKECGFLLILRQDCGFFEAMADSIEETSKRIEALEHSYKFIGFVASKPVHPRNIINEGNYDFVLDNRVNNAKECHDKCTQVLCQLLAEIGASNDKVCPRLPSTTPMVSTTKVLATNKSRTVFINEDFNSTAEIETTEIYETTSADEYSTSDMDVVVFNKAPPTGVSTETTPTSTSEETTTDDNSEEGSSLLWLYIVIAILVVLLIAGGVFGFFAWKKKWFEKWFKKDKKKAVKVEPKKAEFPAKGVVLRPHDENPDLLPDNVWKKKGPIRMMKNLKGPIEHKMANDKSEPLNKPIELDFDNMEEYQIGPGIEQYTGESTTLSFGPLPKSDTVRALTHISVSDMSTASKKPSTMEVKKETPKDSKRSKEDATQKE